MMSMNDIHSLSHSKWNCKYHIVFAPKYRRKVFFGEKKREIGKILHLKYKYRSKEFWCKGYYVDTVGKKAERIREYIQNQLREDQLGEQLSFNPKDPFTGSR